MNINKQKHIDLLEKEFQFRLYEWEKTLNQFAAKLWKTNELLLCQFLGIDEARGNLLFRFDHAINFPPRKNEHFTCFLSEVQDKKVQNWGGLSYKDLRDKQLVSFDCKVVFIQYKSDHSIVGISGATEEQIKKLQKGQLIFLGPSDPPLHYLQNLIEHLKGSTPELDKILAIQIDKKSWQPSPIGANEDIIAKIQVELATSELAIIQGPPGTGKTYRAASFIRSVVDQGFSVMVTAMTNRALIEIAEKEQMFDLIENGKVYKTNLSASEKKHKKTSGLKPLKKIHQDKPPVLLASYYTMSNIAMNAIEANYFDYVIIEEASQAYLATISLARKIGKKCIVIGDKEQLAPIFHRAYPIDQVNNYYWMVHGLSAISNFLKTSGQYILKDTYRLTASAVNCTNAFYGGILNSISELEFPLVNQNILNEHFNSMGGVELFALSYVKRNAATDELKNKLFDIVNAALTHSSESSIAFLAFNRDTVRTIANVVLSKYSNSKLDILVDTVDRIQGLTVDFTVYLIPLDAFGGALDKNRFNVATSRARKGTLIVSDYSILQVTKELPQIDNFFNRITKK